MDQVIHRRRRSRLYLTSSIALAIVFSVIAAVYGIQNQSAQAATPPDSCFAFDAGTGTITDYYDHEGNNVANPACPRDVDIPSTIGGVAVTTIGHNAFIRNQLTSLTLPNSVAKVGINAFYGNSLTALDITTTANLDIGSSAFASNNLTSINITSSALSIDRSAFSSNAVTSVVVTSGPVSVADDAFYYNSVPIESLTYNGTTYIAPGGQQLLPENCLDFSGGTVNDYNYPGLSQAAAHGNACLATDIIIPDTITGQPVTSIGDDSFRGGNITGVVMPSTVTSIGRSAFVNNNITEIDIPSSVVSIGPYAFYDNLLSSSPLTDGLNSIDNNAFGENNLSVLVIPDSVTSIGDYAFRDNLIGAVYVGSGITDLSPKAFAWQVDYDRFGGNKESWEDALYSEDPDQARRAYGAILLPKVYTSDLANPQGLKSSIAYETYTEFDGDGDWNDVTPVGGYIVNPASLELKYRSSDNKSIHMTQQFVGERAGGGYIGNYYLSNFLDLPEPSDISSYPSPVLTPVEQQVIDTAFSDYYSIGDTVTITPPAVAGYITPPTQTFTLASAANQATIVYAATEGNNSSTSGDGENLAATGVNLLAFISSALVMTSIGATLLVVARRRKKLL